MIFELSPENESKCCTGDSCFTESLIIIIIFFFFLFVKESVSNSTKIKFVV